MPRLPLGAYNLRIAAVGAHRHVVSYQRHSLHVYGQVPFSTLTGSTSSVFNAPSHTFRYVLSGAAGDVPFTAKANPCRSVHVDYIGDFRGDPSVYKPATVTILQESLDPVSTSVGADTIGAVDARLVPGKAWSVQLGHEETSSPDIYANGTASCYRARRLSG